MKRETRFKCEKKKSFNIKFKQKFNRSYIFSNKKQ